MKHHILIINILVAVLLISATSCSDYDDYNQVPSDVNVSADLTLWDNISQNAQLSDFAAIIQKAGFAEELQSPHFYTVWAPLNGTYDAKTLLQQDSLTLRNQIVKNQMADYKHTVSGSINERIHTLNAKSYDFVGSGSYTYSGQAVQQINLPSQNGVMHTLQGIAAFYPNIYQYIDVAQGLDSFVNYFKRYEYTYLDTKNSILGPTINGKQTYIDSVMVTYNRLTSYLSAKITNEDSNYTMLLPDNHAWISTYNKVKPYYKYINKTIGQDLDNMTSFTDKSHTQTATVNSAYLSDSLTKRVIVQNLVYNNNYHYNQWVENPNALKTDTLISTTFGVCSNPDDLLAATQSKVKLSNGYVRLVDSLAYHSWEDWAYPIYVSPNNGKTWSGAAHYVVTRYPKPEMVTLLNGSTSLSYLWAEPSFKFAKPEVDVKLLGVKSASYNIYCVFVPSNITVGDTTTARPNKLNFSIGYCDGKGQLVEDKLGQNVVNDVSKVDTVLVGTFKFPVSYYGLGNKVYPILKMTTAFNPYKDLKSYTSDIRMARVILKPVEMDEYEKAKN